MTADARTTEPQTAAWILRQHRGDGRCPQCCGGGCPMVTWARAVLAAWRSR